MHPSDYCGYYPKMFKGIRQQILQQFGSGGDVISFYLEKSPGSSDLCENLVTCGSSYFDTRLLYKSDADTEFPTMNPSQL